MNRILATVALAAGLAAGAASAQTTPPVSSGLSPGPQGTGGIPPAIGGAGDRTGSVTGVGQTKPPGAAVGEQEGTRPDLERKSEVLDEKINRGICQGC